MRTLLLAALRLLGGDRGCADRRLHAARIQGEDSGTRRLACRRRSHRGLPAGIEYGWWQGFTACTGGLGSGQTAEELRATIENAPIVRCDEPAFKLFGLSMAGYNFLYALALAGFAAWGAFRSRP
jgi:hypothetical protein